MVFPQRTALLIYLVVFALMIGCSGGGGETPTSPEIPGNDLTAEVNVSAPNHNVILEIGEVILDTEEMEATVVPYRTTDFTLNVVKFLQPPAGDISNIVINFDLDNCDIPNAYVDLDLGLNHPFPGTEFWGFDTRIIVFAGGSTIGQQDSTVRYPTTTELRMVNADGYTRWWNFDEFGPPGKIFGYTEGMLAPKDFSVTFGTVNGYKYYANSVGVQDMPPNPAEATRGVFNQGLVEREMQLQFPKVTRPFKFKYSICTSFEFPTTSPPTSVDDFSPGANQQEAYQIVVTQDPLSDAYYDPVTHNFGGDLILEIEVWDWQAEGDPEAQIDAIYVESPTLLSNQGGYVEITDSWSTSAGSSPNSVIYSGTLSDVTPTSTAEQELLITVTSSDPNTYEPILPGFLYPDSPLAAYQLFECSIQESGVPPEKSITVTSPNGFETLIIGEDWEITWTSTYPAADPITDVVIEYSTDGGSTYPNVIAATTENDGSFLWDPIPDTPTTEAKVRITEAGPDPDAQDESDDNFTISTEAELGWNPVPGQIRIPVDDPVPNQSTATPDFGIQNDDAGNEGCWIVDQEGGISEGSPYFVDYLLDWSGPGGDAYPSGFNYNFAPFGRHDASSNGIALFGCSANTNQINPPYHNDPLTCIWYLSYLMDDETAVQGDLYFVTWGDEGSEDPPEDDPDEEPWFHTMDVSGGLPASQDFILADSPTFLMCYSHEAGAPPILEEESGDLNLGFWGYPYLQSPSVIYRLGFPEYTTDNLPAPLFQAFDVSDPSKCRLASDSDSYLTFDPELEGIAIMCYMLDSEANWYGTGYQLDWDAGMFYYIGLGNSLKIRPGDDMYVEGGTAVDLEMLPVMTVLREGEFEDHGNWCAVVFDMGGSYVVRVYRIDWTGELENALSVIDTTDPIEGTPLALDVDPWNFTIHVLADNGGTIEATVFDYHE